MHIVRPATAQDGDAIGRVQVETWRAAYAGLLPEETIAGFDVAHRQLLWREGLSRTPRAGSATLVAELDGDVVGFASLGAAHEDGQKGEIYAIYVHPSCWGLGLGRVLIEGAESSLQRSGFRTALLWVLEGNERAERFYRAAGWRRDGRKDEDFQGASVVELRYCKGL
jgi:ribosomal protein S18 acetylase RimI-like enzyme